MLEEKQLFNIRNYFLVIWKRRWIIFCVALIVFVSNLIKLAAETPLFTASAKILIEQPMQPLGGQYGYQLYSDFGTLTETQRQLLHSREFLRKVANELNQQEPAGAGAGESGKVDIYEGEPFHTMLSGLRSITSLFRKNPSASTTAPARSAAEASEKSLFAYRPLYGAGQIGAGLSVQGIKDTDIFLIVSTRADPREAALIANTTAEVFIKDRLARRLESTQQGIAWLQNQLKSEQVGLDRSRIELYEFMNTYGILSLDEKRGTKLDEELKLLEEKARAATENAGVLEIKYQQTLKLAASPNLIDTIPEAVTDKVLAELRTQEIQLQQEAIKLSATYGSNHPKVSSIERQLQNIHAAKSQEIQKIVNALKVQYDSARFQEKSIVKARDDLQNQIEDLKKRTVSYFSLKREVDSNEKVYDLVLNRLKETSLTEELSKSPSASIIERAEVPVAPSSPDVQNRIMRALMLAVALGLGVAFLLEHLDNTFTKPDQIEQLLEVTFLGAVPNLTLDGKPAHGSRPPLVALSDEKSSGAEAYRALRTNLLLSSADVQPQLLLVTSPGKNEGKSSTAANLAVVMAQAGNRVMLVDCDMRRPVMHKVFGLDRDPGLSNLLVGTKVDPQLYVQKTAQANLEVITCGPMPPNPPDLLGSKRMHALLESLRHDYKFIILDSPPLWAATDAAVLTSFVDGTMLVVKAGETRRHFAQRAVKLLGDLNARIIGVVLNKMAAGKDGYYYYDYYYYQYGLPYRDEDEKKPSRWKKIGPRNNPPL